MFGTATIDEWERAGRPVPPPAVYKHKVIKEYSRAFNLHYLIESGTFIGHTIDAVISDFEIIDSIEIEQRLFSDANKKYNDKSHVRILHGDSQYVLPHILKDKTQPALYWLDGHYSWGVTGRGEKITPIVGELKDILPNYENDVILIDDARLFDGKRDYPLYDELCKLVHSFQPTLSIYCYNDIIRIHKGGELIV